MTVAGMAVVSGRLVRDRLLAIAILSQGVVMLLVAVSSYFPRLDVELAAAGLFVLVPLWMIHLSRNTCFQSLAIPHRKPGPSSTGTPPPDGSLPATDSNGGSE